MLNSNVVERVRNFIVENPWADDSYIAMKTCVKKSLVQEIMNTINNTEARPEPNFIMVDTMALTAIKEQPLLGKTFRIYGTFENPLFLARDVAEWIEYSLDKVGQMLQSVDENEKVRYYISTLGGNQQSWFVTEEGLYEILFQSRKPIAKQFKTEVKKILQSVRKHGIYATSQKIEDMLNDPDTMIKTLQVLKAEREKNVILQREIEHKDELISVAHQDILRLDEEKQRVIPFVNYAKNILTSDDCMLVRVFCQLTFNQVQINISQNQMFDWLYSHKYIYRPDDGSGWIPYANYVQMDVLKLFVNTYEDCNGRKHYTYTTKITPKGTSYFQRKLLEERNQKSTGV